MAFSSIVAQGNNDRESGPSSIPRVFLVFVFLFFLLTGALPQMLQASAFGIVGGSGTNSAFFLAVAASFLYDLLRILPLLIFARHPMGLLHPLILAVVVWPLLTILPSRIEDLGGYSGLLLAERINPPFFYALGYQTPQQQWLDIALSNALDCVSLIAMFGGYFIFRQGSNNTPSRFGNFDSIALRRVLVGVIIVNIIGVIAFIQYRGGIDQHLYDLSGGRFRALAGLGPLLTLFDIGFVAMLIWIAYRPQDARHPLFITLLPIVAFLQFLTAGSRASALLVLVMVGLTWSMRVQRIPWRLALMLLPVAFLSLGILNIARTAAYSSQTATQALSAADITSVLEQTQSEFAERRALSGTVPVIADGFRVSGGPLFGATYMGAVFAMVPRTIWPDKPRGPGSFYSVSFLGEVFEGQSVPIGPVAEAYWNFHIAGVIVIFILQGYILRRAQSWYELNRRNGIVVMLFVQIVTQFQIYTDALVTFQQMIVTLIVVIAITLVFVPTTINYKNRTVAA
jgi:hypothetical protein